MDEERFHAEFYKNAKRLHDVPYISRYGTFEEDHQMERFIHEAASLGLSGHLLGLYYDSNASLCLIETVEGLTAEDADAVQLAEVARQHIAQFELLGIIGHLVG